MSFNDLIRETEGSAFAPRFILGTGIKEQIAFIENTFGEEEVRDIVRILNRRGVQIPIIGKREILILNLKAAINTITNHLLESCIIQYMNNDKEKIYSDYSFRKESSGEDCDFEFEDEDDSDNGDEEYENAVDNVDLINWLDEYCYPSAIIEVARYLAMEFGHKIKGRTSHRRVLARLRTLDANCDLDFDELHEAIEESIEFN